jgi:putative aldouronate transport system permease protein
MSKSAKHKRTIAITLMMLPGAIWLIVFRYLPMAGSVIAFQNYRPHAPNPSVINNIIHSDFIGFDNFRMIFASDRAWNMLSNTILYNLVFIVLTTILSIALAIVISEITKKFIAKIYQTIMFFPFFISWVVVSYFVWAFLEPTFGLIGSSRMWYFDPEPWPVILTISNLWKNLGFNCIIYVAAIAGIDQEQYEAAAIDGASRFKQAFAITIPCIKPMIIILTIMALGRIMTADFGLFWNVTQNSGPLQSVTEVFDTYVFRMMQAPIAGSVGLSAAAGLFQSVIGLICILGTNAIIRKVDNENAMF